jgi:uncharacterized protein
VSAAPIHLAGERLMLDPAGALFWPAQGVLAVSDLHLEKGSSFARKGMLLPPWDSRVTLDRLALVIRRWRPRIIVALGDSFHDVNGAARLAPSDAARIEAIRREADFVWVLGNHDPKPAADMGGQFVRECTIGPIVFRHQGKRGAVGEICGHHHPKAAAPARGGPITRPCFVLGSERLMLPAFGAYTGGLDVTHPAIIGLFPRGGRLFLLGRERLFSFALGAART